MRPTARPLPPRRGPERPPGPVLDGILRGYTFRVCADPSAVARALAVRRTIYVGECGYGVPVPDAYDDRSWFLLAEDVETGEAVGSLRVTPRALGALEAEAYLALPRRYRSRAAVEVTRFAVLPPHRRGTRLLPAVALGLFKLAGRFVEHLGADWVVICARPERVLTYQWLRFERTGLAGPYGALDGAPHELLVCDLRGGAVRHRNHRYWTRFWDVEHPEIQMEEVVPGLGLACAAPGPAHLRRIA